MASQLYTGKTSTCMSAHASRGPGPSPPGPYGCASSGPVAGDHAVDDQVYQIGEDSLRSL